jgi:hypothetical protein
MKLIVQTFEAHQNDLTPPMSFCSWKGYIQPICILGAIFCSKQEKFPYRKLNYHKKQMKHDKSHKINEDHI